MPNSHWFSSFKGDNLKISIGELKYVLFPGTMDESNDLVNEVYKTWKLVWSKAFLELDGNDQVFSDGFSRQTKIGGVFYKGICVSLSAFREVNFESPYQREDSLLSAWDEEAFKILMSEGPRVSICSYLSVHPDFRGEIANNVTLKLITTHLCALVLLDSDCDVMTGTMRCNRGTDKSAYSSGASFIKKSSMHGVEVDLVGFYKKRILANRSNFQNLWAERLWSERTELFMDGKNSLKTRKVA